MRLRITHLAGLEVAEEVTSAFGEARVQPQFSTNQVILNSTVTTEPAAWRLDYIDYWGARVVAVSFSDPHHRMQISARTDLDFDPIPTFDAESVSWDALTEHSLADRLAEFVEVGEDYQPADTFRAARDAAERPIDYVKALAASEKLTGDEDVLAEMMEALRWAGVPTRYVSGYLLPETLETNSEVEASVHCWVQVWDGRWRDWDPQLRVVPSDRHIVIATARNRADIPTLTGVHNGVGEASGYQKVLVCRTS